MPRLSANIATEDNTIPSTIQAMGVFSSDIFSINNTTLLCTIAYHSKFHSVKKADGLSADNLIR